MKVYAVVLSLFVLTGCGLYTEEDRLEDQLNDSVRDFTQSCEKQECALNIPKPSIAKVLGPGELHFDYMCWTWDEQGSEKLGIAINPNLLKNKHIKTVVYQKTFDCLAWLGRTKMSLLEFANDSGFLLR